MRCMAVLDTKVPPPLVMLVSASLGWLAARIWPAARFDLPGRWLWIGALVATGVLVAGAGIREFRRASTTVNPLAPERASALVAGGVFRFTRNPMYLGMAMCLIGFALWLGNAAALTAVPAFTLYISRFQIAPEERALAARFGAQFDAYRARVRRWL